MIFIIQLKVGRLCAAGGQQYLINLDEKTTNIHIVDGLPKEYFKSEPEKILYEFNSFLKNWCDKEYHNWINK